jgi:hypothetical protein
MATAMYDWVEDAGTFSASGDNTVLAAPGAGAERGLKEFTLVNNGSSDVTATIKWGGEVVSVHPQGELWQQFLYGAD